jgi:hypothetical protein
MILYRVADPLQRLSKSNHWVESPTTTWSLENESPIMSALPPKADMCGATSDVRYGPRADKPE